MWQWLRDIAEAVGFGDSQPQFLRFDIGTVLYALPVTNTYLVIPGHNVDSPAPVGTVAIAFTGSSFKDGFTQCDNYLPGTTVLIGRITVPEHLKLTAQEYIDVIIGGLAPSPIDDTEGYPDISLFRDVDINYYKSEFVEAFNTAVPNNTLIRDFSYGRPLELIGGDYAVLNAFANYFMLGTHYTGVGAGSRARLEMHALHNMAKLTADEFLQEGMGLEEGYKPDLESFIFHSKRALSAIEGLGSHGGTPFTKDEETGLYAPKEANQQGIFRHECYEGLLVDGLWETMQRPEGGDDVRTRDSSDKPPLGVFSERVMYDGSYELRSAASISHVKSLYIPVPRELEKHEDTDEFPEDASRKTWQAENNISDTDYPNKATANEADEFEYNSRELWQARMRARINNWKVYTPEQIEEEYSVDLDDHRKTLEDLDGPEYTLPPTITLTDPATGREHTYFASESFIKNLPDGSVAIGDGYGSEILMSKGNISIRAAGDLELRPGRDIVQMAPRHAVVNAGKDAYIQSANGSTYIKAEKDLRVLAGNSGAGALTLESRGTAPTDADDPGVGAGVVIKSHSTVAMVGKNMYIGLLDETDDSEGGLDRAQSGSIVIDACQGIFSTLGNTGYLRFDNQAVFSGGGAAFAAAGNAAAILGSSLFIGVGACAINSPDKADMVLKKLTKTGVKDDIVSIAATKPSLTVAGQVASQTAISCTGPVHAESVTADGGSFGNASEESGMQGGGSPNYIECAKADVSLAENVAAVFDSFVDPEQYTIYQGTGLRNAGFTYPPAAALGLGTYKMYSARWQEMLPEGTKWNEPEVKSPDGETSSYVYPGKEHWTTAQSFFIGVDKEVILSNNYRINTTQ